MSNARAYLLTLLAISLSAADSTAQCGSWTNIGDLFRGYRLAAFDDGNGPGLYVAGDFDSAGGVPALSFARWDEAAWSALGAGIGQGIQYTITDMIVHDDGTGGGPRLFLTGFFLEPPAWIAAWDGATWSPVGTGLDYPPYALAVYDDGTGTALYTAGGLVEPTTLLPHCIGRWDGTAWTAICGFQGGNPRTMEVFDDGTGPALYVGGFFTTAAGIPANRIARWDGVTWSEVGGGADRAIIELKALDLDGQTALYAGGRFTSIGGVAANRVAKWDGTSWSALGTGFDDNVLALEAFDDGDGPVLYAGGEFTTADGLPAAHLARWDGSSWSPVGTGADGRISDLLTFDDGSPGGPHLFAAGWQAHIDGIEARGIARLNGCSFASFCDASDGALALCPCGNPGAPDAGCDLAQGTGGVTLDVLAQSTAPANRLTLSGAGFPTNGQPAAVAIRASALELAPVPFGDGLRCVGTPVVRLGATLASGGISQHELGHGAVAGTGTFHYQLWLRNVPLSFCDPTAAFNLSAGVTVDWP